MKEKRIIPCLDFKGGKVVKGVKFVDIKEVGDPVECAKAYEKQGADELVFLDITATTEERKTMVDAVNKTAKSIGISLAVGGGIRTIEDFENLFKAGAGKVSVNSAAIKNPELIKEAAERFGSERVVLAVDAKQRDDKGYSVYINGGNTDTGIDMLDWLKKCEDLGAGEILLTSIDADGTKAGFDIDMLNAAISVVNIPVIASGGCGKMEDFLEVFQKTKVDAALAASVFHFGDLTVAQVKEYLAENGIAVRGNK